MSEPSSYKGELQSRAVKLREKMHRAGGARGGVRVLRGCVAPSSRAGACG